KFIKSDPEQALPDKEIQLMKEHLAETEKEVSQQLPRFFKAMKEQGVELKSLKHEKTETDQDAKRSADRVSFFKISAKDAKGTIVILEVENGSRILERWYFADLLKPQFTLRKGGKDKLIPVK